MTELPNQWCSPGPSFRRLARLQPTVISSATSPSPGSLMARIPVTAQGSSPGASAELAMPIILPGAMTGHRNSRRSMTDCLEGRFVQNWRRRWFVGQSARIIDDSIAAVPWEEHDEQQAAPAPSSGKAASEPGNQATRGDCHHRDLRPRDCPGGDRAHRIPRKVNPVKRSRVEPSGLSSKLAGCVTVTAAGGAISLVISRQQLEVAHAQRAEDAEQDKHRRSIERRFSACADFLDKARSFRNALRPYGYQPVPLLAPEDISALARSAHAASPLAFLVVESRRTRRTPGVPDARGMAAPASACSARGVLVTAGVSSRYM